MAYVSGDHWVLCDICSFQYYRSECVKTWDNLIACPECFDGPRDPLDYKVRSRADKQSVRDARPEHNTEPTVTTTAVTSIASTTASSGGRVADNGGSTVTAKGVCWSTSPAPDTDDSKTSEGAGTDFACSNTTYVTEATCLAAMLEWYDSFTSSITGLTASTKYYLRAYATNSVGTAYGPTKEFTTTA